MRVAAPSTMLCMVPLPRFAGEDHGEIVPHAYPPPYNGGGGPPEAVEGAAIRSERFMIGRLNHVAIAVPDLAAAAAKYRDLLGAEVKEPQVLAEHGVTVVFVKLENTKIELMTPLGPDSPIAAFLERNPAGGVHHLCFEVPDLASAAKLLSEAGARVLGDGEPRIGAHGLPVLFLHPKDFDGTLIELEEVKPDLQPA